MILKSVEKCIEFNDDYYDNFLSNDMSVQNHEYELGIFKGKTYSINKIHNSDGDIEYHINVRCDGQYHSGSWFKLEDIRWENDNLHVKEGTCSSLGAIYTFVKDSRLYEDPGFYYYGWMEQNYGGWTTDKEGKYFKRYCEIIDVYFEELENFEGSYDEYEDLRKELESKIIPDNYSELSFEEQLAICEKYPNNIYYDATRLIDFNEE
jgi:hypothetical protein